MIATREHELTTEVVQEVANKYISDVFGDSYFIEKGNKRDHGWNFTVQVQRDDISFSPMVGWLTISNDGQVENLSEDRIRDMKESAEVYAAKERGDTFARDQNGYVLRYHARIKANTWTTNYIDHKLGARGGIFIPVETPLWRFMIKDSLVGAVDHPLDFIDVNAVTGEVIPLTEHQIAKIVGELCATRRLQKQTATAWL
ncbi:hypothetical protein KFU94_00995 [Chloroflexi bacterium TSY]|nr:hypothetical protein [Chloroflexi bacterium TSY]